VVERGPEKAGVGGSIPSLATILGINNLHDPSESLQRAGGFCITAVSLSVFHDAWFRHTNSATLSMRSSIKPRKHIFTEDRGLLAKVIDEHDVAVYVADD
jgi:hypothetical protein